MAAIFSARCTAPTRQVRLSLPEPDMVWYEAQAEAHGLPLHEALVQALQFARHEGSKPPRKRTPRDA